MRLGVAYQGSFLPEHMAMDFDRMCGIGIDDVVLSCQENDFDHLVGKIDAAPEQAHARGLTLYANFWGYACAFGGGRISTLLTRDPDVWVRSKNGVRRGIGCLNHPALRADAREKIDRCIDAGFDGFFWDEPVWHACYCEHCRAAFSRLVGGHDLMGADDAAVAEFATHCTAEYVRHVSDYVRSVSPDLWLGVCMMPGDRARWGEVACVPSLSMFGTDPYWLRARDRAESDALEADRRKYAARSTIQSAVELAEDAIRVARANGKQANVWLNCWRIRSGWEDEIYEGGLAIADAAPDSLYTWSWLGAKGTIEACDNPERAWAQVERLYKHLS